MAPHLLFIAPPVTLLATETRSSNDPLSRRHWLRASVRRRTPPIDRRDRCARRLENTASCWCSISLEERLLPFGCLICRVRHFCRCDRGQRPTTKFGSNIIAVFRAGTSKRWQPGVRGLPSVFPALAPTLPSSCPTETIQRLQVESWLCRSSKVRYSFLTLHDEQQPFSNVLGLRDSALSLRHQPAPESLSWEAGRQLQQLLVAIVQQTPVRSAARQSSANSCR
ncbi:hypothetical protein ABIB06_007597 [Bradyrhizobium sp. LB8.2]